MVLVPNGESFGSSATSGLLSSTVTTFQTQMDRVLRDGPLITLDLAPIKTTCSDPDCRYNQTYDRYIASNGGVCRSCNGQGYIYTPRQTQYHCNRRWENKPFIDGPDAPGRLFDNTVRVKTQLTSYDHIIEARSATLDGVKVYLMQEPRKTGWNGTNLYVISWWSRKNNKENG